MEGELGPCSATASALWFQPDLNPNTVNRGGWLFALCSPGLASSQPGSNGGGSGWGMDGDHGLPNGLWVGGEQKDGRKGGEDGRKGGEDGRA